MSGTALIIVANGYTDSEFTYALDRCREEDINVVVATLDGKWAQGEKGWIAKGDISTHNVRGVVYGARANINKVDYIGLFDILILPGGVKSIEKVRQDQPTIEMIKLHHIGGKIIASCCHGAQCLIEADLVRNRKIAGYYSIKTDIINAGGSYCNTFCVDGSIVSAAHYDFNGKWMKAVIELWNSRRQKT